VPVDKLGLNCSIYLKPLSLEQLCLLIFRNQAWADPAYKVDVPWNGKLMQCPLNAFIRSEHYERAHSLRNVVFVIGSSVPLDSSLIHFVHVSFFLFFEFLDPIHFLCVVILAYTTFSLMLVLLESDLGEDLLDVELSLLDLLRCILDLNDVI
jgi:hypothetical protein